MRKIFKLLIAACVLVTSTALAAPAQAETPGCVTQYELYLAKRGMTKAQVHRIFDTTGVVTHSFVTPGYGYDEYRSYRKCRGFDGGRDRVLVAFDDYTFSVRNELRVWAKWRWECKAMGHC
jgi:hypothetical protein